MPRRTAKNSWCTSRKALVDPIRFFSDMMLGCPVGFTEEISLGSCSARRGLVRHELANLFTELASGIVPHYAGRMDTVILYLSALQAIPGFIDLGIIDSPPAETEKKRWLDWGTQHLDSFTSSSDLRELVYSMPLAEIVKLAACAQIYASLIIRMGSRCMGLTLKAENDYRAKAAFLSELNPG